MNWGNNKAGGPLKPKRRSESDDSDSNDDDSGDAENGEGGGKKKQKRRRNGSEEDDWTPEDLDDVTHRESQAQVDARPPLGAQGYQVIVKHSPSPEAFIFSSNIMK